MKIDLEKLPPAFFMITGDERIQRLSINSPFRENEKVDSSRDLDRESWNETMKLLALARNVAFVMDSRRWYVACDRETGEWFICGPKRWTFPQAFLGPHPSSIQAWEAVMELDRLIESPAERPAT